MTVYLVGAGPGDPDLLTIKAARLLASADVVVHDRLVGDHVLRLAAPWAEMVAVGKDPNGQSVTQGDINAILIERGRRPDTTVVRLKGGDPYVFGRGGEEALALQANGIAHEVVPGISSVTAGPAAAGIPITHRSLSCGYTVVTGHSAVDGTDVDWAGLARLGTTLVVLMGARRAAHIRDRLIGGGMAPDTPTAVITWATTDRQSTSRQPLTQLGVAAVPNPSVIVIGAVAELDLTAIVGPSPAISISNSDVVGRPLSSTTGGAQ